MNVQDLETYQGIMYLDNLVETNFKEFFKKYLQPIEKVSKFSEEDGVVYYDDEEINSSKKVAELELFLKNHFNFDDFPESMPKLESILLTLSSMIKNSPTKCDSLERYIKEKKNHLKRIRKKDIKQYLNEFETEKRSNVTKLEEKLFVEALEQSWTSLLEETEESLLEYQKNILVSNYIYTLVESYEERFYQESMSNFESEIKSEELIDSLEKDELKENNKILVMVLNTYIYYGIVEEVNMEQAKLQIKELLNEKEYVDFQNLLTIVETIYEK